MTAARPFACPLLVASAIVAGFGATAAEVARLPHPRPATEPPPAVTAWANGVEVRFGDALAAIDGVARLPRPRPVGSQALLAMVEPGDSELFAPTPIAPPIPTESDAEYSTCTSQLRALGVEFKPAEPIGDGGGCLVARPLSVTALGSGLSIGPETILDCATTLSLAEWIKDVVVPTAARTLHARPTKIDQDSAYVCRNRNNDAHAKLSEHAHANAIDVKAFEFAGGVTVGVGENEPGSDGKRFETAVRAGACRYFTTVLGPGSNAAHATHFHFDMAERKSGYRLCELDEPKIARGRENTTRE